mgnify:CR=1 FL=1
MERSQRCQETGLCDQDTLLPSLSFSIWEVGVASMVTESAQLSNGAFYRRSRVLWTSRNCCPPSLPQR